MGVEVVDDLVHLAAEELVHFAEAALGVEGGVVEVVALVGESGDEAGGFVEKGEWGVVVNPLELRGDVF